MKKTLVLIVILLFFLFASLFLLTPQPQPSPHHQVANYRSVCGMNQKELLLELAFLLRKDKFTSPLESYISQITKKSKEKLVCPICGASYHFSPDVQKWKDLVMLEKRPDRGEEEQPAIYCPCTSTHKGILGMSFDGALIWVKDTPSW